MKNKILLIIGIVAIVVIAIVVLSGSKNYANAPTDGVGTTTESQSNPSENAGQTQTGSGTTKPKLIINITAPITGARWELSKLNTISWSKPAQVAGTINLLSSTGKNIGTILPTTDANQTSYSWDTVSVALSKNNASRINVVPGDYKIQLIFYGNNLLPITSGIITILPAGTPEKVSTVLLQNYSFVPNNLTVQKGQKITFTNKDSAQHHLAVTGILNSISLNSGESYLLDTTSMKAGTYNFYCDIHPGMTGQLTVK